TVPTSAIVRDRDLFKKRLLEIVISSRNDSLVLSKFSFVRKLVAEMAGVDVNVVKMVADMVFHWELISIIKLLHDSMYYFVTCFSSVVSIGRHKGLERSCASSKSVAPVRNRNLVYPDSDEEDEDEVDIESMTLEEYARYELAMSTMKNEIQESSFDEILDDLFRIGAKNIRKMELEVPNRCDDINDYEDCDQENGELLDLPTFSATNEIASDSEQVEDNIDIAEEKEEVPMKDVKMDENHDLDHLGTEEALQWSLAKYPFLIFIELNDQSSFLLHTILSFVSNEVKKGVYNSPQVRGLLDSFYVVKWLLKYSKLRRNYNGYSVINIVMA
ncbi:hypothetical protein Tco_1032936, partial [Tanacetum coccineum]